MSECNGKEETSNEPQDLKSLKEEAPLANQFIL